MAYGKSGMKKSSLKKGAGAKKAATPAKKKVMSRAKSGMKFGAKKGY